MKSLLPLKCFLVGLALLVALSAPGCTTDLGSLRKDLLKAHAKNVKNEDKEAGDENGEVPPDDGYAPPSMPPGDDTIGQ